MQRKNRLTTSGLGLSLLAASVIPLQADAYPIAGVNPDQRPAGAPVIQMVNKDQAWYAQALTGVVMPQQVNLRFLESQGNWFTPFTRPGMTGPYDIRGWHSR
ncbi:MAG: hypothetical protein B0D96_05140 [Candidatus Sedimenticola endophacoides]|uniref:Uncharacterized protein n=1 Tax=Candidatus Sedimenticola endophacoides TaxID=2548426 RepID=A0A657Q3T3_9GAMM|nr:MAG: hypothetical protein B0D94_05360 [Candidatus Sedimenticola endophacoides]OQX35233.1 MAG: hypothetical protein B0D84_02605 [Candidatus Sedimenticola endophacoides]OQX36081.1 MAG: hypothetical protein B0D96_05140 [Candidatus Sedimenticola endophacoides]OQX40778.1 MAG: hypothetical protein B0D89_06410 [Candidatus Sedimenticola endophacoides]OQX42820.1 MAG: hypothetical protein B0D88_05920 [Candidatus Sedimenticola endophacoides]